MTVSNYLIPLNNTPQKFLVTLAGVQYTLICRWNDQAEAGWIMDIQDSNQNPIVQSIPLVTGVDLLEQLAYLEIGGSLYVFNASDPDNNPPNLYNLGVESNLYFQTESPDE